MNRSHALGASNSHGKLRTAEKTIAWDPAAYAANSSSQQAWARELIAKLELRGGERILDVGCGDGKVTAELARVIPKGVVTGIDSSPEMIRFARKTFPASEMPNLEFHVMDARQIRFDREFDLIFSNAALHWVEDHPAFLRGASAGLRSGGRLVVSCGGRGNAQDVFAALRAEMRLKRWREFFRKMEAPYFFHAPEEYEKWLPRFGFKTRSVRLADKDMIFDEREKFAGWFRTTWLPYTQRVPENLRGEFIAAVVNRYVARHPPDDAGRVHVRMVRLEIDAVKV
jgi:trans-aconitate 2-methyltransferase